MKQGLSLRVSQHLALTPQLQQSIRLLQISTLELNQEIDQMLDDNPFLEKDLEAAEREEFGLSQSDLSAPRDDADHERDAQFKDSGEVEVDANREVEAGPDAEAGWEGDGSVDIAPDDIEWGGDAPPSSAADPDASDATEWARSQESLPDHLHRQALSLRLSDADRAALRFLIENLNEDGYLEDSLEDLAANLQGGPPEDDESLEAFEELVSRLQMALRLLQHMEPVGVGARDLAECMTLQLQAMTDHDVAPELRELALSMCRHPLELLAKRDLKRLAMSVGGSELELKSALALIARLEPKPGRRFVDVERQIIVPDVIVTRQGNDRQGQPRFRVMLNPEVMPKLRVQEIYANALKGAGKGEAVTGLQQRLQEARWFIKNIQQRFDTILRVSQAIALRQRNFFIHGELAMRPMVLREIADELSLHESTISRVTTAKYMSTPMGTFELKYFFGSGLGTETGANASSTAVRALIKQFIASENPKKPLSDNQLSDMLKEQGIDCARRTVAKYREALRIPPTNLRKAL
ncbi:MAG: RNA polymerase factor sigma-54 [Alphaproteobacteria bacterium]|nr:RNA polymerase factor sigma-54 [Alphaproteobacteria bacterium]